MEKAKISLYQLFVLMVLFELGTAIFVPLAIEAKQDAWLAILIGMVGGFCVFLMYCRLYSYYPELPATEYVQKIIGSFLGRIMAFLYIGYFIYGAARVLRDFGEMLNVVAYRETPVFVLSALMMLLVIYTVSKGIEVVARTGELLFMLYALFSATAFILVASAGIIEVANLRPILEEGWKPVLKTAFREPLYFPFGESIVFLMLFPYIKEQKKIKKTGLLALAVSGFSLSLLMAVNVGVLGVDLTTRSLFPLLSTIRSVEVAGFLERLDVYFMIGTIIAGFFKITLFFYVVVTGSANLFKIRESVRLVYPMGMVVLLLSILIASSIPEHFKEGVNISLLYIHLPFQIIFPAILLLIAFLKRKKAA